MALIIGTEDYDDLEGGSADDIIRALGGSDFIFGGGGADRIFAGEGADTVYGAQGDDIVQGGDGNDDIDGGAGSDILYGGGGNDQMWGDTGADFLFGGAGDDFIEDSRGGDFLDGGSGVNTLSIGLTGAVGVTYVFNSGAARVITPFGSTGVHFQQIDITGGDGDDRLTGGSGADTVRGWFGNDQLRGGRGDDLVVGDNGDDVLWGGVGNDILLGGGGNDLLYGGPGNDILSGGSASDVERGSDVLEGGPGADTFSGDAFREADLVFIHSRQGVYVDLIQGIGFGGEAEGDRYAKTDIFTGIHGKVLGSDFNDALIGGIDEYGRGGDDRLTAGFLTETLTGGDGADTFIFSFQRGQFHVVTQIADFGVGGADRIDLSAIDAAQASGDQAFKFIGTAAFSGAAGELRYEFGGAGTILQMSLDKNPGVDATIEVAGAHVFTAGDFVL